MTEHREGQIPFADLGVELVIDLDSGEKSLRTKKPKKSAAGQVKRVTPNRQWWERMGLRAFSNAAEGWKVSQAVRLAETFGQNVEFAGAEMSGAETEERLKRAFLAAKGSHISSLAVVEMIKAESFRLEQKLGSEANWVPAFVDSAIDILAEAYNLNPDTTRARKKFAHQRDLHSIV